MSFNTVDPDTDTFEELVAAVNAIATALSSTNTQVDGMSATLVDNFTSATYRSGEYLFSIRDMNANAYQVSKALVIHDGSGSNAYITEYGTVSTNNDLGVFSASANSSHVLVYFTSTVANVVVTSNRTLSVV